MFQVFGVFGVCGVFGVLPSRMYFLRGSSTVGSASSKCGFKALNAENQLPAET